MLSIHYSVISGGYSELSGLRLSIAIGFSNSPVHNNHLDFPTFDSTDGHWNSYPSDLVSVPNKPLV